MKDLILKIIIFTFLLNLAIPIMLEIIPGFNGRIDLANGLGTDVTTVNENTLEDFSGSINTGAKAENPDNFLDRILDKIGLGIVTKALGFIDKWMFGFVNMMEGLFGGYFSETLNELIFGGMKFCITLLYISFGVYMFTGKTLDK